MSLLFIVLPAAVILTVAYFTYGSLLTRLLRLNADRPTPAVEQRDGLDFEPLEPSSLVPQHFSAIAAAGPIVGPILAGLTFGWLPALIWILVGSIFIGGVHDFTALVASIRHKARTIAEVVRDHMSQRSYLLFLIFIWIALIYIIVAFTDVTAASFVGAPTTENGGVGGGAIASASLMYLVLTLLMGVCLRYLKMPIGRATVLFILLVGAAIVLGPHLPFDIAEIFNLGQGPTADAKARKIWDVILLVYCLGAGVAPVWLILQPRGHLGGYFLYFALGAGALGLMLGGGKAEYPMFRGFTVTDEGLTQSLFPMLFITIACGACSGFHSLIASGTTSKQLRKETDAKVVGYGTMLLEAMVAIVSLCCVMMFAIGSEQLDGAPNMIYAQGIGRFLEAVYIPSMFGLPALRISPAIGITFALMAFTTFVYDTLDVCTRLGRFIIQELTGMHNWFGRFLGTALTAGIPLYFLLVHPADAPPVWKTFWALFGASNQLLAALTLLGVTVWLWKTRRAVWVWAVTGIPTLLMYIMSTWALIGLTLPKFYANGQMHVPHDPVPWAGIVLLALAALMFAEAVRIILSLGNGPIEPQPERTPAASVA
jgi:carbon starvation protein